MMIYRHQTGNYTTIELQSSLLYIGQQVLALLYAGKPMY